MKWIGILRLGNRSAPGLETLAEGLQGEFEASCQIIPGSLDDSFAYHPERQQFHSTEILARMDEIRSPEFWRLLAVTDADLYIPILTFVFGEAQLGGPCAVVSTRRLHQNFYGLSHDPALFEERLLKEAVHELGHTFSLPHCEEYECAMAPSHAVERIDLKGASLCPACRSICNHATGEAGVRFAKP